MQGKVSTRLWAELIDAVICLSAGLIIGCVAGTLASPWVAAIIGAVAGLAYSMFEIFYAATPGKRLLGLRISAEDGRPASRLVLAKRWALKQTPGLLRLLALVTAFSVFQWAGLVAALILAAGLLLALQTGGQTLHDAIAGTSVYRDT
jgi:uncharacterized RDD family membrane protein YckC